MKQKFSEYLAEAKGPTEDDLKSAIEGKIGSPFDVNLLKGSSLDIKEDGVTVGGIKGNDGEISVSFTQSDLNKFGLDSYDALGKLIKKYV